MTCGTPSETDAGRITAAFTGCQTSDTIGKATVARSVVLLPIGVSSLPVVPALNQDLQANLCYRHANPPQMNPR
jgi:hypothetical protein